MNANIWITIGVISGAIAAFSLPYGFYIKSQKNEEATVQQLANDNATQAATTGNNSPIIVDQRKIEMSKQRPWVDVTVGIVSPLYCDDKGWDAGRRWHIVIEYCLENVGEIPATSASFVAEMIPFVIPYYKEGNFSKEPVDFGKEIHKEYDSLYRGQEELIKHNMGFGQVLFPGKTRIERFGLNVNPKVFEKIQDSSNKYTGHFLIIVCVTYGTTESAELFHTAKAFQIFKKTGNQFIDQNGETVSVQDLAIVPHPVQGSRVK